MLNRVVSRLGIAVLVIAAAATLALAATGTLRPQSTASVPGTSNRSAVSTWLGQVPRSLRTIAHAAAATLASASSNVPQLQFQGTSTVFGLSPRDKSALMRQADCSLTQYSYYPMLAITPTTDFQDTLHQLAGLGTQPDLLAHGCKDPTLGVASTAVAYLGRTASGLYIAAQGQTDHVTDLVAYAATGASLSYNSTTLARNVPPQLLGVDLNKDGFIDLVAAGLTDPVSSQSTVAVYLSNGDGTFKPATYYDLPVTPNAAFVIDDLNGDGVPDILVPTTGAGNSTQLTALLGRGDGTFSVGPTTSMTLANYTFTLSSTIATGDFNGDGKVDVITADGTLHPGKGDGSFGPGTQALPVNFSTAAFAVGDFNKDGKLDIAELRDSDNNPSGAVAIFVGHGDGTFTIGAAYDAVPFGANMVATDLDGDGNLDLVVGRGSNGLFGPAGGGLLGYGWIYQVLMGHGDGTFNGAPVALVEPATGRSGMEGLYIIDLPSTGWSSIADFNNDGRLDLLTPGTVSNGSGGTSGGLAVSPGIGDGSFGAANVSPANVTPVVVAAADLNGDGKIDAVAVGHNPSGAPLVAVLFGNGTGALSGELDYPLPAGSGSPARVVVGDFNGDGLPDIAVATLRDSSCGNSCTPGVYVLYGQSGHTFIAPALIDSSATPLIATGDLNNDGRADLVVADAGLITGNGVQRAGVLHIYLGNTNSTFTSSSPTVPTLIFSDVALADMNKDGKLDVVLGATDQRTNTQVDILLGNGAGDFGTAGQTLIAGGVADAPPVIAVADFDGDGNRDVAFFLPNGFSGVLFGSGTGTLPAQSLMPQTNTNPLFSPIVPGEPWAVDLNGDGKPDLVFGDVSMSGVVSLINQIGTGFTPTTTSLVANPNPATLGQSVTLSASVTSAATTTTPAGTVTFLDGTTSFGSSILSSGTATFTTSLLTAGSHSLSARYSGATSFAGSTSNTVALVVSGSSEVTVPNVVGATQTAGTATITGAGLVVGSVTTQSSATVAVGLVVSESPAAGASVSQGSAVNLVVSSGPAQTTVPVKQGGGGALGWGVIGLLGLALATARWRPR